MGSIVTTLVKFCRLTVAILAPALVWAASQAELLFQQGQKAERAGDPGRAYVLYTQAAAADPGNLKYWSRAQALRPVAGLLEVPEAKRGDDLSPEKTDPTLFGHISDRELEDARKQVAEKAEFVCICVGDTQMVRSSAATLFRSSGTGCATPAISAPS